MPKVIKKVLFLPKNYEEKGKTVKKIISQLRNGKYWNILNICLTKNFTIMSEVQSKVVEIIVDKLGVKESEVVPEASFTNHLGADSLDTVELIMEFEKAFDIQIPDEDAEKIATVGDAINYIESHK